ncbi:MAG TPA: hypothetical protein VK116_02295, partial [Planctomycetota bacterium]|nr:hypothetical protein [Planctomycetota bacterium]
ITRHPWDLEALRVREEILVADPPEDGGDPRLDRLVRALTGFAWPDDNAFAQELERIEELIGARGPGGTIIERALARQPSEGRVDAWFRKRADRGAEIAEVRPALAAVAASDSKRSVNALVHFWRKAERARRNDWVEEVFRLHGEADAIAFWAKRCPQGFGSSHAQRILSTLPTRLLRGICERLLEDGDARGIVESPALLTCLRSIAKSSDAEVWIAHTIDRSPPSLRRDLLAVVDTCSTRELFTILERILERENERNDPDPELVHLALSALRKSSLPHARNLLRRIRTERKRLRYTFSRPIREILLLLDKLDEVGP